MSAAPIFVAQMCDRCRAREGRTELVDSQWLCDECLAGLNPDEIKALEEEVTRFGFNGPSIAPEEILLCLANEPRETWTYLLEIPGGLEGPARYDAIYKALCQALNVDIAPAYREFDPEAAQLSLALTDALAKQDWNFHFADGAAFYKGARDWDALRRYAVNLADLIGDERTLHLLNQDTPADVLAANGEFTADDLANWRLSRSRGAL